MKKVKPMGSEFELALKIDDKNQISENWFLLSDEELFRDENIGKI